MDRYHGSFVQIFGCNLWSVLGSTLLYSTVLPVTFVSRYSNLYSSFIYTHTNKKTALTLSYLSYLLNYLLTYLFTPCSRVILEKLAGIQAIKKFLAFCGTRNFITAFKSSRHLSLSWTSTIQPILPQTSSWISALILSSLLRLGLSSGLFLSGLQLSKQFYIYLFTESGSWTSNIQLPVVPAHADSTSHPVHHHASTEACPTHSRKILHCIAGNLPSGVVIRFSFLWRYRKIEDFSSYLSLCRSNRTVNSDISKRPYLLTNRHGVKREKAWSLQQHWSENLISRKDLVFW